jgi:hypothetical protein
MLMAKGAVRLSYDHIGSTNLEIFAITYYEIKEQPLAPPQYGRS